MLDQKKYNIFFWLFCVLAFPYEFWDYLVKFYKKKVAKILTEITLNLYIILEAVSILTRLIISIINT